MTDAIVWLAPADITPGTSLAADLTDADGNVLFTAGTRLEPHRLALLARQGIDRLPVAAAAAAPPPPVQPPQGSPAERPLATAAATEAAPEPAPAPAQNPSEREEEIRARLEQHFALAGDNAASKALFHALLTFRLQRREV